MAHGLRHRQRRPAQCSAQTSFKVPPELVKSRPVHQASSLLNLPPELLLHIFRLADEPADVLLALTCKALLHFSTACHLRVPLRTAHVASWNRHTKVQPCRCTVLETILFKIVPKHGTGRPQALGMCVDCAQLRSTKKMYWQQQQSKYNMVDVRDQKQQELWAGATYWFCKGLKLQCPYCCVKDFEIS